MVTVRLTADRLSRRRSKSLSCTGRVIMVMVMVSLRSSSDSISTSSLAVPVITMGFTTNRLSRRGSLGHDGGEEAEKSDGERSGLHLGFA